MTILIADDHPIIRSGVAGVLSVGGYSDVSHASDGKSALDIIEHLRPEIAILDVRMPGLDGIEVLRQLQASGSDVKVILLTAELANDQLLDAMRFGASAILFKDGAEDRLLDCVRCVKAGGRYFDKELTERALVASLTPVRETLTDLTPRERELVEFVGKGLRNREIAKQMGITEGTVKVYLSSIYVKLGVGNRTALALLIMSQK